MPKAPKVRERSATLAQRARAAATRTLIAENRPRYEELLTAERVKAGLAPDPGGKSPTAIRAQMAKAQKRLDALAAELAKVEA